MTWENILKIRAWSPLTEVAPRANPVIPGVWQVAKDAYLITQPYNRKYEHNRPEAPFITLAIWAGSPAVVKRCIDSDSSSHSGAAVSLPPTILLRGTNGTYGELLGSVPYGQRRNAERAVYSNVGAFVHKVIEIERFRYCFLDSNIDVRDQVYAVEISLLE